MTMDTALELRALAVLVAASVTFTALGPTVYRRDPARRRIFIGVAAVVLLVAPWWSFAGLWTLPVGMAHAGGWSAQPVPWLFIGLWWLVGGALMARTLARVAAGRRTLIGLPPLQDLRIAAACNDIADRLGDHGSLMQPPADLKEGRSPCASSLGRRVLVLPSTARDWPATTLHAVIAHELAHLRRGDDRVLLMVRLLTDWYWWMPWLKRLQRRYVEAMEESCDDLASRALQDRESYVSGLVQAARSLRADSRDDPWPAWVALLGQSHLAARVERLVTAPRPTLNHADGRWVLLWASIGVAVLLTARPAAIPPGLPGGVDLRPLATATTGTDTSTYPLARVETRSHLWDAASGVWRPMLTTARDPLPVYPAAALTQGLQGTVTVELDVQSTRSRALRLGNPRISSSDPSGTLTAAVERALARANGADLAAGLRAVSAHDNDIATPPPGSSLRLRKTYRFVLRAAGSAAQSH